jgi:hypothetical protein
MSPPPTSKLAVSFQQLVKNESHCWFPSRVAFTIALWALWFWLLSYRIYAHQSWVAILLVLLFIVASACSALIIRKRRRREFLTQLFISCFTFPVVLVIHIRGYVASRTRSLISKCLVVREPRFGNQDADFNTSPLCSICRGVVSASRLLTGSHRIFHVTSSVEKHEHHTRTGLELSAKSCHLCNLLFEPNSFMFKRSTEEQIVDPLNTDIEAAKSLSQKLKLKVSEKRSPEHEAAQLLMQIQGGDLKEQKPLIVEEVHGSK